MIKSWSTTQSIIALSSAEAEYYAMVDASARGLGFKSLFKDLGIELDVVVESVFVVVVLVEVVVVEVVEVAVVVVVVLVVVVTVVVVLVVDVTLVVVLVRAFQEGAAR